MILVLFSGSDYIIPVNKSFISRGIGEALLKTDFQNKSYFPEVNALQSLHPSAIFVDLNGGNPKTNMKRHTPSANISQAGSSEPSILDE